MATIRQQFTPKQKQFSTESEFDCGRFVSERKQFIYAIARDGQMKIGYSKHPIRRVKQVSSVKHQPFLFEWYPTSHPRSDERKMHWLMSQFFERWSGEWFLVPNESRLIVHTLFWTFSLISDGCVPTDFSMRDRSYCSDPKGVDGPLEHFENFLKISETSRRTE